MHFQWQTRNNCGPASIAIVLGYYDHWITQQEVNEQIPPGPSPCKISDFMPQYGLKARVYRSPPSVEPIRLLLANHIPVIAGQRLELGSEIGHYRVIRGYDDASAEFLSADPFFGAEYRIDYDTFYRISNPGSFIPVYPSEMDALVRSLMQALGVHEVFECPP